jgi:hypothetical protein
LARKHHPRGNYQHLATNAYLTTTERDEEVTGDDGLPVRTFWHRVKDGRLLPHHRIEEEQTTALLFRHPGVMEPLPLCLQAVRRERKVAKINDAPTTALNNSVSAVNAAQSSSNIESREASIPGIASSQASHRILHRDTIDGTGAPISLGASGVASAAVKADAGEREAAARRGVQLVTGKGVPGAAARGCGQQPGAQRAEEAGTNTNTTTTTTNNNNNNDDSNGHDDHDGSDSGHLDGSLTP